jgi:two-component system, OmpR family, phosphate regulon sensor histidine kinase PhoR
VSSLKKHFPWRIFYRIALFQSLLILAAILISGLAARYFFKSYFESQLVDQLRDSLTVLSRSMDEILTAEWCARLVRDTQFHLVAAQFDGTVICDSMGGPPPPVPLTYEKDFQNAVSKLGGYTFHYKFSADKMLGSLSLPAQRVILRGSLSTVTLSRAIKVFDASLGAVLALTALGLVLLSIVAARRMVFPLGRLLVKTQSLLSNQTPVLREDLQEDSFGEWSDLESNIDSLRKNLEKTTQTLSMEQVELDALMAAISDAVLAVDPDGTPLFYNSRFELNFGGGGFTRQQKFWEVFRDPEILEAFRGSLNRGKNASTRAVLFENDRGVRRYFTLSVSPLRRQGQIYGALGIFHDVTELKSAEQMRIDFVANVSHELRTPLTSIKGYTETLLQDINSNPKQFKDTSVGEFLAIIARNTSRLMNLMGDLLDLSSIESTEILQKELLRTSEVTARVLKQMEPRFQAKHQKVETHFEATAVMADSNRLEQVLANLLDNAQKFTPDGGTIYVTWVADEKNTKLRVKDTGPGIPAEHHGRLFERFYRIDKARSREQGGTGLGLAIVKHILQRHEGSVSVESEPGKGATFICRFPNMSSHQVS